jgi:SRSO17 transposase
VQWQWCGRFGKTENCQAGVDMGYVTRTEQVLVDERLYRPEEWTRKWLTGCGVPKKVGHRTRHELALEMLADRGSQLPHGWHHHQALSLLAVWFLVLETRRGEKGDPGVDRATGTGGVGHDSAPAVWMRPTGTDSWR